MESLLFLTQFLCLLLFHFNFQVFCYPSQYSNSSFPSLKLLCPYDQSQALLQFKSSFSVAAFASYSAPLSYYDENDPFNHHHQYEPAPYSKSESWKEGTDCCLWDGVTCDLETGNVIGLNLSSSMLYGTFHSNNSLFLLSYLQKLDLSNNHFNYSHITSEFSRLLDLTHLNLKGSKFVGSIPLQISRLSNLISLDLSQNDLKIDTTTFDKIAQNLTKLRELSLSEIDLSMVAPSSFLKLSSSLSHLNLRSCNLSKNFVQFVTLRSGLISLDLSENYKLTLDAIAFVKLVQNLTKLKELKLNSVNLSLVAPSSLTNLSSSLRYLGLSDCELQGNFSNNIHLSNLISLDLSSNENLRIDKSALNKLVQNLPSLREIDLSFVNMSLVSSDSLMNLSSSLLSLRLNYCGLRGEFPGNLLQRQNLRLLDLQGNDDLTGFLPPMSNWSSSLQYLDVSSTKISIYLVPHLISNLKSLKVLRLRSCNFTGSNLSLFSYLTQLTELDLSSNNLDGQIPPSFGNLQLLTYLNLSHNNFNGEIPLSFGNLQQLFLLDLSSNNLSGHIPSSFTNLNRLVDLRLRNNSLGGPIPSEIEQLSSLTDLDLSNNLFNETIPSSLFRLPNLSYLYLQYNQLHGLIGQFQSKSMRYIDLSNNKLHGSIPSSIFNLVNLNVLGLQSNHNLTGELSSSICRLQSLEILDLSENNFTGLIPQCLGNFSNTLYALNLGMNSFHGTIPAVFSEANGLRYLNLNRNQLQGRIPPPIVNCRNLEMLDLSNNHIDDTFPFFLENLPNLQILVLCCNKLHGSLKDPNSNSSFAKLRIFDISNNMFGGHIPTEYFKNFEAVMNVDQNMEYMRSPNSSYDYSVRLTFKGQVMEFMKIQNLLTTIDLSRNEFTGEIPISIGLLKSLKLLNISHNGFTANIPPFLANLTNLEALDLSSNKLTGRIPLELADLTFLQMFRVSNNQLEGPIPRGNQFNTFDNSSYEGNSGLCGFPLEKDCNNGETQLQDASKEDDSTSENGFGWQAVLIGYGSGVLFGLVIGFVVLETRKRSWFVRMIEAQGYLWRTKFDKFKKVL